MRAIPRLSRLVAFLALSSLLLPGVASAGTEIPCAGRDGRQAGWSDEGIGMASSLGLPAGRYAPETLPAAPTALVVMFHGHGNDTCSWRNHLRQAAAFTGNGQSVIAVAMDYTGQAPRVWHDKTIDNYGWFVKAGAADSITAAQYFLDRFPTISKVIAFGVSMGGNSSGLAVAGGAVRHAGRSDAGAPVFDYWVDVEGVNNLIEEYLYVRTLAPFVEDAQLALDEIEEENGGPIEAVPGNYVETTNVARARDMASLAGAVVINGLDDSLVPTEQSPEMAAALNAAGVPTRLFTVLGNGGAESGSTYTSVVGGPVFDRAGLGPYNSPLAGHGWEGSDTQIVIRTGFEQLYALLGGATVTAGETIVPGI